MTFDNRDWRVDRVLRIPGGPIEIQFSRPQMGQARTNSPFSANRLIWRLTPEEWLGLQMQIKEGT